MHQPTRTPEPTPSQFRHRRFKGKYPERIAADESLERDLKNSIRARVRTLIAISRRTYQIGFCPPEAQLHALETLSAAL